MHLRSYQTDLKERVIAAWQSGARNVMAVSPTGSGKTHLKSDIIKTLNKVTCCIAHRQELVVQISESLASFGIPHRVVASNQVVRFCAQRHSRLFGRSFVNHNATVAVASVQTLLRRSDRLTQFLNRVELWDIDEAHHCLEDNQWGRATALFPRAIGLGVTATPLRCDRKALDGVFDQMVVGPSMRELIDQGHLSDYRIFCPPQSLNMSAIRTSQSSGEFVQKDVLRETRSSQITGDVVQHYLRIAPGLRGLTFAVDVQSAVDIANAYNEAGVKAAVVTAKTPDNIRVEYLERLADGDVVQLVNVDLFGEGMDCPALEVVTMARPTQSYGLYVQQFGRVLRTFEGKTDGIVIDHVGNVVRHGLPDAPREWSLAAPEGRRAARNSDAIPLTTCTECFRPYERIRVRCPYCGHKPVPASRSGPEFVDGDLVELDPTILEQMRNEVARVDGQPRVPRDATHATTRSIINKWKARQDAQTELRKSIALWAGNRKHGYGESDSEIQRRFYLTFGTDVLTAQSLGTKDAVQLTERFEK